jgi:hypothetical protein
MSGTQRPDDSFLSPEPDVEGHLGPKPVIDDEQEDVEGHFDPKPVLSDEKRIDR